MSHDEKERVTLYAEKRLHSKRPFYILMHLGLGDALLCNGLVREMAERKGAVEIPCYHHNLKTVTFMFKDDTRIKVTGVKDDGEADDLSKDRDQLRLGYFSKGHFDPKIFDEEFYRQAGVDFNDRWNKFKVPIEYCFKINKDPFAFMHDDENRGFVIERSFTDLPIVTPDPKGEFFSNNAVIMEAEEVHCINSSFLILTDSLPEIREQELFLHKYPRPTSHPVLRKDWNFYD